MKQLCLSLLALLFTLGLNAQCSPTAPDALLSYDILGRTINVSNVQVNGAGNSVAVAPGATFTVDFDWNIGTTISACPGCVTYFYFGLSGTSVPGGPNGTSYANTHCMGSVFSGQSASSNGSFTAPTTPGYYFITLTGTWTFWCHQFGVNHVCNNRAIAMITVGTPTPFSAALDSTSNVSSCSGVDGYISAIGQDGIGCYTYNWEGPGGFSASTGAIDSLSSGTYTVTISDAGTCDTVISYSVTAPSFSFSLGNDSSLCENEQLTLDATTANASYLWQDGSTSSTITVNQAGNYWVQVDSAGCLGTDSINISYSALPQVYLGQDSTLCEGDSLTLDANSPNSTFLWQDGAMSSSIIVTGTGQYWVEVDSLGCSNSDSINLIFTPLPIVNLGADTLFCEGTILSLDASNSAASYLWQDGSTNSNLIVSTAGSYWVEVAVGNCVTSDSISIGYIALPNPDLGADTTICYGNTALLDPAPSTDTYLWSDGSSDQSLEISSAGTYWLELSNDCASIRDSIEVFVDNCNCEIQFPTAFTPNGDLANETFGPILNCFYESYQLVVFNRWGQKVFSSSDLSQRWDGRLNNQDLPAEGYIYIFEYRLPGEEETQQLRGAVNILR